MKYIAAAAVLLLALPAQAEEFGQIHEGERHCQPKTEDPNLLISACLQLIDSNLLDGPGLAAAWTNVSAGDLELKQYDEAVKASTKAILLDPDHWRARLNRGVAEAMLNKAEQAEADLDSAVQLAPPTEVDPLLKRGGLYLAERRYDLAIADLTAAIARDPKIAPAYGLRAVAYAGSGKSDLAAADKAQYLALDPADSNNLLRHMAAPK